MGRLEGKRAIITGGGNGIGAAAALRFAQEGAKVTILEIKKDAGERSAAAVEAAGGACLFLECDITKPEAVEAAVTRSVNHFGGLEVLYNNAGGATAQDGSFLDIPLDEFWRTISVDLYGTFLTSRFAVPHIRDAGGGSVINTSSIRAMKGTRGADAYTSAKGGIITLTKAMALQCAAMKIRVNAISPGAVLTERTRSVFGMTGDDDGTNPARPIRTGRPIEVAEMALFLASDQASLVNGAIIPVDSGACAF
ncbi:SDR family oxidoreductase [Pelagibius litoralis]|uniref:SDR family oxidoreductase n=1 Tax=Pelagibius litoralis TaxID=374515 RepID=A0A967C4X1_9PROT|nr:SDR family oxidoreductase [Pelagibius litoralis]NIA67406.1 SDR family oxidoreductase [Pelagibius litoralis]